MYIKWKLFWYFHFLIQNNFIQMFRIAKYKYTCSAQNSFNPTFSCSISLFISFSMASNKFLLFAFNKTASLLTFNWINLLLPPLVCSYFRLRSILDSVIYFKQMRKLFRFSKKTQTTIVIRTNSLWYIPIMIIWKWTNA